MAEMTHFLTSPVVNMPITKKDKTVIKSLFTLEYHNAKRVSWQRRNLGSVYKLLQELWVTGSVKRRLGSGRRHVLALLIPLILFMNWSWLGNK